MIRNFAMLYTTINIQLFLCAVYHDKYYIFCTVYLVIKVKGTEVQPPISYDLGMGTPEFPLSCIAGPQLYINIYFNHCVYIPL